MWSRTQQANTFSIHSIIMPRQVITQISDCIVLLHSIASTISDVGYTRPHTRVVSVAALSAPCLRYSRKDRRLPPPAEMMQMRNLLDLNLTSRKSVLRSVPWSTTQTMIVIRTSRFLGANFYTCMRFPAVVPASPFSIARSGLIGRNDSCALPD